MTSEVRSTIQISKRQLSAFAAVERELGVDDLSAHISHLIDNQHLNVGGVAGALLINANTAGKWIRLLYHSPQSRDEQIAALHSPAVRQKAAKTLRERTRADVVLAEKVLSRNRDIRRGVMYRGMIRALGEDPKLRLQELIDLGLTRPQIARELKKAPDTISKWATELGIELNAPKVGGVVSNPVTDDTTNLVEEPIAKKPAVVASDKIEKDEIIFRGDLMAEEKILLAVLGSDPQGLLRMLIRGGASNADIARSLGAGKVSPETVDFVRQKYNI